MTRWAAATTPVQRLGVVLAHLTQPCQPSPKTLSGRPAHRPFQGLLSVHKFALAVNEVRVEYGQRGRVGHHRHCVRKQRPELEERRKPRFAFLRRAAPCRHDHDHRSAAGADDEPDLKRQFFGRRSGDLRAAVQFLFLLEVPVLTAFNPKKRCPFQFVPVIALATCERLR